MASKVQMEKLQALIEQNWKQLPNDEVKNIRDLPIGGPIKLVSPRGNMYVLHANGELKRHTPIGCD